MLERAIQGAVSKALRLEAQVMLADTLGPLGQADASIELAKTVLAEADDPKTKQRALSVLQNMYQGIERYIEAETFIQQALELAEQLGELDRANGMRFAKARILRSLGRYAEAAVLIEGILPFYRKVSAKSDLIQILTLLGNTYNLLGSHAEAEPLLHEGEQLSGDSVGPALRILALSNLLYGLICQGRAEELLHKAEAALELGDYAIADHLRNNLVLAYLRLGWADPAKAHCLILAEKAFDPNYRCTAWARLAMLSDPPQPALEKAQQLYLEAKTPPARFATLQAAMVHGSKAQKTWAIAELEGLERSTLPWLFQAEYDQLKALSKTM